MGQESRCRNDRTSYPQANRLSDAASSAAARLRLRATANTGDGDGWASANTWCLFRGQQRWRFLRRRPPRMPPVGLSGQAPRAHLHFTARPTEELCIPGGELQLRPPLRRHRVMHVTCGLGDQCARTAPEGAAIARAGLSRRRPALRGSGAAPAPYYALPWARTLVTLRCKLKSRSGLALGPLGAPEYESRVNSRSRMPLPTFFCRSDHPEWWSLAEVHGCNYM